MSDLCTGKIAIVTGAAGRGIGRSTALTLAREGATVVVNYHTSEPRAADVVATIAAQGGTALAIQADIFSAEGCRALVATTIARFGRVDIGVINPGGGWHPEPPDALDPAAVLDDVQHELAPVLHLLPLLLPPMYAQGSGRIVAVGVNPNLLPPAYAYNVAKAARLQAMLLAHGQAWPHGVTLNVVAPGPVADLATLDEALAQSEHAAAWPARPTTSAQDIAESIAFLCSEAGRFITGAVVPFQFAG